MLGFKTRARSARIQAMGRDLLYRPPTPIVQEEEGTGVKKKSSTAKARNPIARARARELGQIGESVRAQIQKGTAKSTSAHKHQYFNNDISGVRQANFGTKNMSKLRGGKEATDLRKVVLPASGEVEQPEPGVLKGALDLMGGDSGFAETLEGLLGRQGAWAQSEGMTVDILKARMAELEFMVEARKAALARMGKGKSALAKTSVTILQAESASQNEPSEDLAGEGTALVRETAGQAEGMHARLSRMFGVKMQ